MHKLILLGSLMTLIACNQASPEANAAKTDNSNSSDKIIVTIGPELQDCVGVGPMKCMVVDGEFFYDQIQGFIHRNGVTSTIEIEREQFCDPEVLNSCPQDGGIYKYKLVRVVSETP